MKLNILLIILIGILGSCNNSSNENQLDEFQTKTCKCFEGIGSSKGGEPISEFLFSNNQSLVICGYKENEIISEFDVFNCGNGNSISQYGATQICQFRFRKDTIEIIELKNLPSANWKRDIMPIGRELIVTKDAAVESLGQEPFFVNPEISMEQQNKFLDEIERNKKNGLQQDWDWEEILAKLEVLSLMQNQRAKKMLFTIQELTNYNFDGAISEQYKKAIANIEWMEK